MWITTQYKVFGICLLSGFLGGLLYEPFAFFRLLFGKKAKNKGVYFATDMLFWTVFSLFYIFVSVAFKFPSFRVYMWCGYALGGILYLKSLHRILAFLQNMCYNSCIKRNLLAKEKRNSRKRIGEYDTR